MKNDATPQERLKQELAGYRKLIDQKLGNSRDLYALPEGTSPLTRYVNDVLNRKDVGEKLRTDEVNKRVLSDTLNHFLLFYEQKSAFRIRRSEPEFRDSRMARCWSEQMIEKNWEEMVNNLATKYDVWGFQPNFYRREFRLLFSINSPLRAVSTYALRALWSSMMDEWETLSHRVLQHDLCELVEKQKTVIDRLLHNNLTYAPLCRKKRGDSLELFNQTWALMGGRWNDVEYERMRKVAMLQQRYPVLEEIANDMGRKSHQEGQLQMKSSEGMWSEMQHAAKSDIVGVSLGNDLSSLLPQEMVMYADEETENLFYVKYVNRHLQTFLYESRSNDPRRLCRKQRAVKHGPMVVCVDMSGSMTGGYEKVAMSLCMRLAEMCHVQHRACYLIAFSVQATPVDVMHDRARLLKFFQMRANGNTDARHMLDETFKLLESQPLYQGADVLWISDFRIPMPPHEYLLKMERLRQTGTRWLGLQLGIALNRWYAHFNKIYQIEELGTMGN